MLKRYLVVGCILSFISNTGHAVQEFVGAKAQAMGGAWRAIANDSNAIELNPANLGANKDTYQMDYSFKRRGEFDFSQHRIAMVDNKTGVLATGGSFIYETANPMETSTSTKIQQSTLGVALNFSPNFKVGFNAHRTRAENSIGKDDTIYSGGAGLIWNVLPVLTLALTGHNLTNPADAQTPLTMAAGAALKLGKKIVIAADALKDYTTKQKKDLAWMGGAQFFFMNQLYARAGYTYDKTDPGLGGEFWSAGLSWRYSKFEISYTFTNNFNDNDDQSSLAQGILFF